MDHQQWDIEKSPSPQLQVPGPSHPMPMPLCVANSRSIELNRGQEPSEESYAEFESDDDSEDGDAFSFQEPMTNDGILQNMEMIDAFCREKMTLLQLWMYFTNQTSPKQVMSQQAQLDASSVFMNYTAFDEVVYSALAYFVSERNPQSPVATRRSLNALIEPLTVSLLSAYDPTRSGHVDFGAFRYFGEYLKAEHGKLRQSLAETPKEIKIQKGFFNQSQDIECDEFDRGKLSVVESHGQSLGVEEDHSSEDVVVLDSLGEMEQTAQRLTREVVDQCNRLKHAVGDEANELCRAIAGKTQKLLYLTKEMEIHCNLLRDDAMRYSKAKEIQVIDAKRDEIQQNFSDMIQ